MNDTTTYNRPLPVMDAGTKPFWDALRRHSLEVPICRSCGQHHFYPRELCPHCHSDDLEWAKLSGTGEIYTFTIVRRPSGEEFTPDVPFIVALVTLMEGPRITASIVTDNVEAVRIGQKVKVFFDDVTNEITFARFQMTGDA